MGAEREEIKKRQLAELDKIYDPELHTKLPLTQGLYTLVDKGSPAEEYKWCAQLCTGFKYFRALRVKGRNCLIYLHRFLTNCPKGKMVDHINHNPLDNRMCNLRICTNAENLRNKKSYKNSSSKYKGVSWYKRGSKWAAQIRLNNKKKFLGYFTSEEEAARAYDKAAKEMHGEFAYLNFPKEKANFDFQEQIKVGDQGEKMFQELWHEKIKLHPGRDGDFISELGVKYELKTDTYPLIKTPNFFIERYSDGSRKTPGGPWQAVEHGCGKFLYLYKNDKILFEFSELAKLCEYLDQYLENKSYIQIKNKGWTTIGYKVPREDLKQFWRKHVLAKLTG